MDTENFIYMTLINKWFPPPPLGSVIDQYLVVGEKVSKFKYLGAVIS